MTLDHLLWLIEQNQAHVIDNSYQDCHTKRVTSIGIFNGKANGLRLFIAHDGAALERNDPSYWKEGTPMSIGFHEHRRDMTLEWLAGTPITSWNGTVSNTPTPGSTPVFKYDLMSPIVQGGPTVPKKARGVSFVAGIKANVLGGEGHGSRTRLPMMCDELHTVSRPTYTTSIWAVHEGMPSMRNGEPPMYSNDVTLAKGWDDGLYRRFDTFDHIKGTLKDAWERAGRDRQQFLTKR